MAFVKKQQYSAKQLYLFKLECDVRRYSMHDMRMLSRRRLFLPLDAMHNAVRHAVARCPSVRLSVCPPVTFVYSVETNKYISSNFCHHLVATPFSFFPYRTYDNIPTGIPLTGVECRWGRQKSLFSSNI